MDAVCGQEKEGNSSTQELKNPRTQALRNSRIQGVTWARKTRFFGRKRKRRLQPVPPPDMGGPPAGRQGSVGILPASGWASKGRSGVGPCENVAGFQAHSHHQP